MKTWTLTASDAGARLDVFLAEHLAGTTRSAIQKAIKEGRALVNDAKPTVHRFLKAGDRITWDVTPEAASHPKQTRHIPTPTVIKETADWIVINKPAGLLVHPTLKTTEPTLIDWLVAHDANIGRVGENPERPGIVHRLDREVSGLLVVAKTQKAYESLKKQFAGRTVKKVYEALVYGSVKDDRGDIKFKIARSTSQARMAARPVGAEGKAAWTHYETLKRSAAMSLLEIEILSGRTHQIRAHLHALGHPILGDTIYKRRSGTTPPAGGPAPHLMLQSIALEFDDPESGERQSFHLEPDPAFEQTFHKA